MNCYQRNTRTCNIEELLGDRHGQRCSLQEGWRLSSRKLLPFRNISKSVMSLPAAGRWSSPSLYQFHGFLQQTAGANDGFHRPVTLCFHFLLLLTTSLSSPDLVSFPGWHLSQMGCCSCTSHLTTLQWDLYGPLLFPSIYHFIRSLQLLLLV